jgi:hypothetical protein
VPVLIRPFPGDSYQLPEVANHLPTAQSQPGLMLPATVGHSVSRRQPRHSCFRHQHCDPLSSAIRANPCPEVTDPFCRLPLPTLFYRPEAVNLGDLLRIWVRLAARVTRHQAEACAYITHSHFQGPPPALRTPQEPWCF